MNCTNFSPGLR